MRRILERTKNVLRRIFARSAVPVEQSLLAELLAQLASRDIDLVAVGCLERGGHELFVEAIESVRSELDASGRFRLEGINRTDHIFSPLWGQEWRADLRRVTVDHKIDGSLDCAGDRIERES